MEKAVEHVQKPVHDRSHRPSSPALGREADGRLLRVDGSGAATGRIPGTRARQLIVKPHDRNRSPQSRRPFATAIWGQPVERRCDHPAQLPRRSPKSAARST
jgi:hypothetical protein